MTPLMKTSFIADETSVFKEILITLQLHYKHFIFLSSGPTDDVFVRSRFFILFG